MEGSATREYYLRLGELLPPEFAFEKRTRRPPRDPFNVLLSIGYTLVYGYTESIVRAVGLLPWQGFYHQGRGRHAALASDLMEPFRHIVERAAMTLVLRGEIRPDAFTETPAGACLIEAAARRKYLALLIGRFETPVKALGDLEPAKLFEHMHRQALSLRDWIEGRGSFKAWRIR
jgi:CRISPR-associated endonuclease Cas1